MLPYILFEKYIDILALELVSPVNRNCASCIGTLSFPLRSLLQYHDFGTVGQHTSVSLTSH